MTTYTVTYEDQLTVTESIIEATGPIEAAKEFGSRLVGKWPETAQDLEDEGLEVTVTDEDGVERVFDLRARFAIEFIAREFTRATTKEAADAV